MSAYCLQDRILTSQYKYKVPHFLTSISPPLPPATLHLELHNSRSPNVITLCFVFAAISLRRPLLLIYQTLTPSSNFSITSLRLEILPLILPGALSLLSSLPLSLVSPPRSVYPIALEMLVCMSGFSQDCELHKGSNCLQLYTSCMYHKDKAEQGFSKYLMMVCTN